MITERRNLLNERRNECPPQWYVGFVRPAGEFLAERMLNERGIVAYCPARITEQLVSHRKVVARRLRPLFPRYLFVGFEHTFMFHRIADTPMLGVLSHIVEDEETEEEYKIPVVLKAQVITQLMEKELHGELDALDPNTFRPNDKVDVTISEGVTLHGMVVMTLKKRRAEVAVEMFGQKRLVRVGFAQIVKVL